MWYFKEKDVICKYKFDGSFLVCVFMIVLKKIICNMFLNYFLLLILINNNCFVDVCIFII